MGYWKSKVLPKIQKVFGKDSAKKAAATEACKSFDESKEEVTKQFEEKKAELQPKVIEIYEASSDEIKCLVKEPKEADLKQHSVKVQQFLDVLVKIEFPGSKAVCEASSNYGPRLVSGPILFVFEKVSTFVVAEEKPRDVEGPATTEATAAQETTVVDIELANKPKEEVAGGSEKPTTSEETPKA